MAFGPIPSGCGMSTPEHRSAAFSNTRAPGGTVHRYRMAPEVEARITQALDSGQLSLTAAKVASIEPNNTGARVTYRRRR